ncbi:MAG: hypothetical protein J0M18_18080 [Ignavibacteria bacterium]|nr:hypothetical protein [Ignavibacteria bacterium]
MKNILLTNTHSNLNDSSNGVLDEKLSKNEKARVKRIIRHIKKRVEKGVFLKKGTYQKYIAFLQTQKPKPKSLDKEVFYEKHHIIPKYKNGSDDNENLILIEVRQHILAHLILYLEQGNPGDLKAYTIRKYYKYSEAKTKVARAREIDKVFQRGFYDSKIQSENGKKGGKIGWS